ncbi:MAG: Lrp/AsnC family transcriptional regulator [Gammaproteobacteria bacterium]|nr:Lrp/AsnC family transcriptional regulator [Gammaproteobacteria bacterium]
MPKFTSVLHPLPQGEGTHVQTVVCIDATDRRIILATQAGLPRVSRPYHKLADELGLTADDVMARLQRMQRDGIIRRISAVPNHYKLGFKGNGMSVWDVPDADVRELGRLIGALDSVSHCYHRPRHLPNWSYNLFAMVHGRDRAEVLMKVAQIADLLGDAVRGHDVLFSTRILKKTGMRLAE